MSLPQTSMRHWRKFTPFWEIFAPRLTKLKTALESIPCLSLFWTSLLPPGQRFQNPQQWTSWWGSCLTTPQRLEIIQIGMYLRKQLITIDYLARPHSYACHTEFWPSKIPTLDADAGRLGISVGRFASLPVAHLEYLERLARRAVAISSHCDLFWFGCISGPLRRACWPGCSA